LVGEVFTGWFETAIGEEKKGKVHRTEESGMKTWGTKGRNRIPV